MLPALRGAAPAGTAPPWPQPPEGRRVTDLLDHWTRDEAGSADLAALIDGAGLIYLSGGNPQFLARTLRGTRVWAAIEAAWRSGAALAGCSAGAIALTDWVPAVRTPAREPEAEPGLGVLPWVG